MVRFRTEKSRWERFHNFGIGETLPQIQEDYANRHMGSDDVSTPGKSIILEPTIFPSSELLRIANQADISRRQGLDKIGCYVTVCDVKGHLGS